MPDRLVDSDTAKDVVYDHEVTPDTLTGFERDILRTLGNMGSVKGLTLKDRLNEEYDKEVHHGRLYPNLDGLVEDGLVSKGRIDKRTNSYKLTEYGESLMKEMARVWSSTPEE